MLAYKIIVTILDAIMIMVIMLMKKESEAVSVLSLFWIAIFAMNLGLVWN